MSDLNIEVILKMFNPQTEATIREDVLSYLKKFRILPGSVLKKFESDVLTELVECIIIEDVAEHQDFIDFSLFNVKWFVYNADYSKPMVQNEYSSDGEINIATHLVLPNADLIDAWENLYYDNDIKDNLLRYATTMMKFSDCGINGNIITCNKVILLHGPPGTGKTSLCKALAHKLSVRMKERYKSGLVIEINSHSLFSRYFSESGKLVTKMFSSIRDIIENEDILVCVLIDEVESLAHAREQCLSGVEPSDSIRVVNAVLTQIDQIKRFPNVLILATSNLTKSIDLAFIDRADIKQFLGLPKIPSIYKIYLSCIIELQRVDILDGYNQIEPVNIVMKRNKEKLSDYSRKLLEISGNSVGLSGRVLRKIPFIAHALFSDKGTKSVIDFLEAMDMAVKGEKSARTHL